MSTPAAAPAPPEALRLADFLPYRLSVLANRVSRALAARYAREFDLTIPEWRVMAVLGEVGVATAGAIAEATEMDKVAISRAVARLKAAGRIAARADAGDQRRSRLSLTPAGQVVYRNIAPLALSLEARLHAALSPAEQAGFEAALSKLDAAARDL
ncbi:MAG: MarR family winged helix-turn-helix transcriptional regulator [Caulobacterales bacterium]|jgi:DNA-binding MarR family transcriptional regulator